MAAGLVGGGDQARAEIRKRQVEPQQGLDQRIGELARQAVGAEQKQVAGLGLELEDVGRDAVLRAQGARDDVACSGERRASCWLMRPMRICSSTRE